MDIDFIWGGDGDRDNNAKLMVTTVMMALYETRTIMVIIKGNFLFYPDDDDDDDDDDQDWSFGSGCTEGCIILHVI